MMAVMTSHTTTHLGIRRSGRALSEAASCAVMAGSVASDDVPRDGAARSVAAVSRGGGRLVGWMPTLPTSADRSEEHTSELQSLMRISYAVFCLKKTKHSR